MEVFFLIENLLSYNEELSPYLYKTTSSMDGGDQTDLTVEIISFL